MILPFLLAMTACQDSPDSAASGAPAPGWTTGRTHDGRWLDIADSYVPWALRDDGLVVREYEAEAYGSADAPFESATLCTGIGMGDHYFWPPCILSEGKAYSMGSEAVEVDSLDIPGGAKFRSQMHWGDGYISCAAGGGTGGCTQVPVSDALGGLAETVKQATAISGGVLDLAVATDDHVYHWPGDPPGSFEIRAVELRYGTTYLWALDTVGEVWLLRDTTGAESFATGAVTIGGEGLWQLADGTLWGAGTNYNDERIVRGPALPGVATKLLGNVHEGCALIEHDLFCWSNDPISSYYLPFPDYITPDE